MAHLQGRLKEFLSARGRTSEFQTLHPDASTRGYFRIPWEETTAIACVYPERLDPAVGTYVDVTGLFLEGSLPVAEIIDFDVEQAVVIQEDLGDSILRDEMLSATDERREALLDEAITLIARIQAATPIAFERDSIASRLKFDTEKLSWELDYFKTHYYTTLKQRPLPPDVDDAITREFHNISAELEKRATVLCHRDFHAANLMLDGAGQMRIIDHQDARIGSVAYDLVSLLLDRMTELPKPEWVKKKRELFLNKRAEFGLPAIEPKEFEYEFNLQTIQRCLKAAGTFSYQSAVRGKTHFLPFIRPMFGAAVNAAEQIGSAGYLTSVIGGEIYDQMGSSSVGAAVDDMRG